MNYIKDLVTVTGEYQKDGETKKARANIGKLFQREDGSQVMKIESIPVNFSGWVNLYDKKPKEHDQSSNDPF